MQSIGDIISKNRKKMGYSQKELADKLCAEGFSLTYKAISKWENHMTEPGINLYYALCRLLEIDMYEAYDQENPHDLLRGLNEEGRRKALDYIELLHASGRYEEDRYKIIPIRTLEVYDSAVSAGRGSFLEDSPRETYEVGNLASHLADFGVRISGDSMEPEFSHGQIAWIQRKERLDHGEIGIFYLNGEAYIKKLHRDSQGLTLHSLNSLYAPIPVKEGDTFCTFGKVVGKCTAEELHHPFVL